MLHDGGLVVVSCGMAAMTVMPCGRATLTVTFCDPPGGRVTAKSSVAMERASVPETRLTYDTTPRRNEAMPEVGVFSTSNGRTTTRPLPKVLSLMAGSCVAVTRAAALAVP